MHCERIVGAGSPTLPPVSTVEAQRDEQGRGPTAVRQPSHPRPLNRGARVASASVKRAVFVALATVYLMALALLIAVIVGAAVVEWLRR